MISTSRVYSITQREGIIIIIIRASDNKTAFIIILSWLSATLEEGVVGAGGAETSYIEHKERNILAMKDKDRERYY